MPLNMLKLSVGTDSLEELHRYVAHRQRTGTSFHTTRMVPKRMDELLDGGSLYWVIKGHVQGRQLFRDIEPFTTPDGIKRCRLHLASELIPTRWVPRRPFQGWRYLVEADVPPDLQAGEAALPADLQNELADLGLL
ncbi:DUF1489 family protein [Ahrensia sp. R2A130]|uniref:DUF1489 family protein n=1 Tax=Ahrensia sp. R2A130 TaxID=744979 RepID=UPI0001E0BC10|nr:DUF1489 domain-containing protein [Ahrensia sp. R2A130]EFL90163.1 putative cytoplasmic protein [Ahrensia sp. R2A130]